MWRWQRKPTDSVSALSMVVLVVVEWGLMFYLEYRTKVW